MAKRRHKSKKKKRKIEFSLGTSGNMKFNGVRKLCDRLGGVRKKLSSIT